MIDVSMSVGLVIFLQASTFVHIKSFRSSTCNAASSRAVGLFIRELGCSNSSSVPFRDI